MKTQYIQSLNGHTFPVFIIASQHLAYFPYFDITKVGLCDIHFVCVCVYLYGCVLHFPPTHQFLNS
jgi:hypothetical protein